MIIEINWLTRLRGGSTPCPQRQNRWRENWEIQYHPSAQDAIGSYRGMGDDLTNEISPIEASLERSVDMKRGAFVGREALEDRRRATVLKSEPACDPANEQLRP
jgi:hypothetical protein